MLSDSTTSFLPSFSFYECHTSGLVAAPPERAVEALTQLDMRTDPVIDRLLRLREWPTDVARRFGVAGQAQGPRKPFGLDAFTPLSRERDAISFGLVGRFWRPDFGLVPVADAQAFLRLDRTDLAKLVLRFEAVPDGPGGCRLRTETFVYCPSWSTRLAMTPYWLAIRLASGWIRRRTLAMVARSIA